VRRGFNFGCGEGETPAPILTTFCIMGADTLTTTSNQIKSAIDTPPLAPPTLSMEFGANDSPMAGQEVSERASDEVSKMVTDIMATPSHHPTIISNILQYMFRSAQGSIVTSSRVRARLLAETDNNVTLQVKQSELNPESTTVFGRGEVSERMAATDEMNA